MKKFENRSRGPTWFMALLLVSFIAGCGDTIFGNAGSGGGGPGPAGAAPNLGAAATFGIAATAGVTDTATVPFAHINGNAILDDPGTTCNGVTIGAAGTFGLCGGSPPTITGTVISSLFDPGATRTAVIADLRAAFLAITPPAGPPAAGSRGGATNLPSGTTLGAPAGSALVQGDNYFVPGLYQSTTSILITGDLTLDAQGNPNAVFIFQSSSTVTPQMALSLPGPTPASSWSTVPRLPTSSGRLVLRRRLESPPTSRATFLHLRISQ